MSQFAVVLLVFGGMAALLFFGHRFFAYLGGYADRARPTFENQARPGHGNLGGGAICVVAPIIAAAFYNPSAVIAEPIRTPELWSALTLLVVYVLTPLGGVVGLLMWKNAKLEWSGDQLIATNLLGKALQPGKVIAAKMTPPIRGAGRVGFQFENGWEFADTSWINIRRLYERVRAIGASAEPWKEKATWSDVWSR